jgi:4-amino-4-deoxy-L-arabinose transferase-like glycosyltransferase
MAWVVLLALTKIAMLLLATSKDYGYFRDELYFLDAAKHLALGYVDFPPLVALLGAAVRAVLGISPLGLRLLPAIAGALVIVLAGLMARELGAGAFGQAVAALACLLAPVLLVIDSFFSMNPFDELWWALLAYLAIRLLRQDQPRLWLLCGAVVGLGLLTKESILVWSLALMAGLALTPARRHLRSGWFWLAGGVALLLVAPYLWWQLANGWPTVEFWSAYREDLVRRSALAFVLQQIVGMNPGTVLLSMAGIYFYLVSGSGRPYRAFGWALVVLGVAFALADAKAYFLAPVYPMLFAGGACVLEAASATGLWRWARPAYIGLLVGIGWFLIPITLPVLPPATLAHAYAPAMANPAIHVESSVTSRLPEWLAGRLGWEEMAAAVGSVYAGLPPGQQRLACILAGDYGEAGALNLYGPAYGLPPVISGHNNYFLWGPGDCSGQVIIAVGMAREKLETVFGEVLEARHLTCADCMAGENELRVYVCLRPRLPLRQVWPEFKHYGM